MTDKIQQARRELFEAWTKIEHGDLTRRQDGEYFDDLTHGAWLGFNAALDCVEIMIMPKAVAEQFSGEFVAADCRLAINVQGLGLRVK